MFALCEGMKWSHLPNAGGLYDQDPELLDGFQYIFAKRAEHQAAEDRKREKEANKKPGRRVAGRRR